jgi:hypothetical protein
MQGIVETHIQAMDQIMDAWEEQLKSPNPTAAPPSAMLSNLKTPQLQPSRHLAKRRAFPKGGDESLRVLDAIRGAVAKSLGRHDDFLG